MDNSLVKTETKDEFEVLTSSLSAWLNKIYSNYSKKILSHGAQYNSEKVSENFKEVSLFSEEMVYWVDQQFIQTKIYLKLTNWLKNITKAEQDIYKKNIKILYEKIGKKSFYPERILLVLLNISSVKVDLMSSAARLDFIRSGRRVDYDFADMDKSIEIFKKKTLNLIEAELMYSNEEINCVDVLMAGGDGTRFLKILVVLKPLLETFDFIDDIILNELKYRVNNQDIAHLLNVKSITKILNTPLLRYAGSNYKIIEDAFFEGRIKCSLIHDVVDKALFLFDIEKVSKAFSIAYLLKDQNDYYFSFLLTNLVLLYAEHLKYPDKQNNCLLVLKDEKAVQASKFMKELWDKKIFSEKIFKIYSISTVSKSLAFNEENLSIVFEENVPVFTSAGHGRAFLNAFNKIKFHFADFNYCSFRTVDNGGKDLAYYTRLAQQAAQYENNLKLELIKALRGGIEELNRFRVRFSEISADNIFEFLKNFIDQRWDHQCPKFSSDLFVFADYLESLPLTVVFVLDNNLSEGGGLYALNSGHLVIIDKCNNQNEGISLKFNPMVFSCISDRELSEDLDSSCLFVTRKTRGIDNRLQVESASTHLATEPRLVLKRIIAIPKEEKESLFIDQKTLEHSSEERVSATIDKLHQAIDLIAEKCSINQQKVMAIMMEVQEKMWNFLRQ